jgi:hypothetical protein
VVRIVIDREQDIITTLPMVVEVAVVPPHQQDQVVRMATIAMLRMDHLIQVVQEATCQTVMLMLVPKVGIQDKMDLMRHIMEAKQVAIYGVITMLNHGYQQETVEGGLNVRSKARTSIQSIWC